MAYRDKTQGIRYQNEFNREKYDRVVAMLPKGSKQVLKDIAQARTNGSVNELVKQAITLYCPEWITKLKDQENKTNEPE